MVILQNGIHENKEGIKIYIYSVGTFYPESSIKVDDFEKCRDVQLIGQKAGIKSIKYPSIVDTVSEMGKAATENALRHKNLDAKTLDQLVFISEGISDYLYMDTSKTIIKKLNPEADGAIHANDFFKGFNGTMELIRLVYNQLESNTDIKYSAVCTSLNWKYHSKNFIIGNTILGNGAGTVILSDKGDKNEILTIESRNLSEFNTILGFKYGGSNEDITEDIIKNKLFNLEIINNDHFKGIQTLYQEVCLELIDLILNRVNIDINSIDYLGIAAPTHNIIDTLREIIPQNVNIISSLSQKGYLGSLGVIDLLDCFINNEEIKNNSLMLVLSIGLDPNIESFIIRK